MDKVAVSLQVFFAEPFWVGIVERVTEGKLSVCRIVFGPEPKDYEIYRYVAEQYYRLQFSPAVEALERERHVNPKRMQKEVRKAVLNVGTSTKSQQALKLQQEQQKTVRKTRSKMEREEEKDRLFELKQQKRKEKHKGR